MDGDILSKVYEETKRNNNKVDRRTWEEFRELKLLWWINTILHTLGWAICITMDEGKITEVYPARVKFRGFSESSNEAGYAKISEYLKDNAEQLYNETKS